ncbi:uncharacterized protein VDAG_05263 [Verticillium dahliae VdLs.17]|uniref:Azaphilone pigments biosynthesis cluster protein L N-terminal domain-containing protein n=1 Tax=Verticillium dahliae (strain VdLs.17 / ATCC MYA-4575 / FGSC 10137) TaxID=498257 RepID=G2X531_VERDV|nr:uncharacterized protein VDAG_05263 [Verticillium dahliae VdLs.17]EGY23825.1 hypothetical protein VDAG_05263 [Verticillium dahliae VdLs.17]KAH6699468.1 hypothetical protein EV126DRAFT_460936 [Verticillium dahliae]
MAEIVGLSSGVLALAASALKSSAKLYETIKDIRSHPHQVRELLTELASLNLVLRKLSETGDLQLDVDLTALTLTLTQCRQSCDEVEAQLLDSCSRSSPDRTSFRDWAKLKFNGSDGLEGFRQQLIRHNSTITVVISFANLRTSATSTQAIHACRELIASTTAIEQTEVEFFESDSSSASAQAQVSTSQMLFGEGVEGIKHHMHFTLRQLEQHRKKIADSLVSGLKTPMSAQDQTSLDDLERQANTLRQCLGLCSNVDSVLESQVSNIENHAEGDDTIQFMVSTDGKTINGKNRAVGKRLKQAGGHFGEDSLQQVSQDFKAVSIHYADLQEHTPERSAMEPGTHAATAGTDSTFGHRHGPGVTLAKQHMPGAAGTGQTGG